jgi:hypothetical protein
MKEKNLNFKKIVEYMNTIKRVGFDCRYVRSRIEIFCIIDGDYTELGFCSITGKAEISYEGDDFLLNLNFEEEANQLLELYKFICGGM